MKEKFYLTTPLYYVNARPHIGHSYTNIAADALARWHRLTGKEVKFLTGTDEHGQKIARAAQTEGMEPQAFTDKISQTFSDLWKVLNISEHEFIRTTKASHKEAVYRVWIKLNEKGDIYQAAYTGYYCTHCETFLTEESVRQMQAESKEILCPDCKRPAEKIEETNYFFKLSKYQDWLTKMVETGQDEQERPFRIVPETRRNEVLGFLKANQLEDLCVSRPKSRLAWGIETPLSKDHVTYVWLDALVNYITACGYDKGSVNEWWPADAHLIGKDILRHHAIYWPIILKALDLAPPKLIFAHGWWVIGGEKMSKSKGNAVDPVEVANRFGVDAYRYFLLRETAFGSDGLFSEEALTLRYNTDLANDLGNLLHRSLTMCEKYFDGVIPSGVPTEQNSSDIAERARNLQASAAHLFAKVDGKMRDLAFSEALREIWAVINEANKFIESSAPWTLHKQGKNDDLRRVIIALAETLRAVAKTSRPFIPEKAKELWKQIGMSEDIDKPLSVLELETSAHLTMAGVKIQKGVPLFPRIEA